MSGLAERTIKSMDAGRRLDMSRWDSKRSYDGTAARIDIHRANATCGTPFCLAGHIIAAATPQELAIVVAEFGPMPFGDTAEQLWQNAYGEKSAIRLARVFLWPTANFETVLSEISKNST